MSDSEHDKTLVQPSQESVSSQTDLSSSSMNELMANQVRLTQNALQGFDKILARIEKEQNSAKIAKLDTVVNDINQKCDTLTNIDNNLVAVDQKLDQLHHVDELAKANTIKLEDMCEKMPSVNQFKMIDEKLTNLTQSLALNGQSIERQSIESNDKFQQIVDILENSPDESFEGDAKKQNQFKNMTPNHQSTPNRAVSFADQRGPNDQNYSSTDVIQSNLLNDSIQHARAGVQRSPIKPDAHDAPHMQTRKQREQTLLQQTNLKQNSISDPFNKKDNGFSGYDNRYHNSADRQNDNTALLREALKTRRNLCQNPHHLEKFDKSKNSIGHFILSRVSYIPGVLQGGHIGRESCFLGINQR